MRSTTIESKELVAALAEANKPLIRSAAAIERAMQTLAHIELAKLQYGAAELEKLMAAYRDIRDLDTQAFENMQAAQRDLDKLTRGISRDDRVLQFGEEFVRSQRAPMEEAHAARVGTMHRYDDFCLRHPLIRKLFDAVPHRDSN